MLKKVLVVLLLLVSMLICHQIYWYSAFDGNLRIWVNNQSDQNSIEDFELYLDENMVVKDDLKSGLLNYKSYTFKIAPGKHSIRVKSNSLNINQNFNFNSLLVKRGIIQFSHDLEDLDEIELNVHISNLFSRMTVE